MAAPPNKTFIEGQIIEQHSVELQNKDQRAFSAFQILNLYSWNGNSPVPNVTWTSPDGNHFEFNSGAGEILMGGTGYSGLNSAQKRIFYRYLPKFVVICLRSFDDAFNL